MELLKTVKTIRHLYATNKTHPENNGDLQKTSKINYFLLKLLSFAIWSTAAALMVSPILVYVLTGQLIPAMAVKIPFLSADTTHGYLLHLAFHIFGAVNAALGLSGADNFIVTTMIHIWPMTRILERAVQNLNLATQSIRADSVKNSTWLKTRMRNIILMQKEIYL